MPLRGVNYPAISHGRMREERAPGLSVWHSSVRIRLVLRVKLNKSVAHARARARVIPGSYFRAESFSHVRPIPRSRKVRISYLLVLVTLFLRTAVRERENTSCRLLREVREAGSHFRASAFSSRPFRSRLEQSLHFGLCTRNCTKFKGDLHKL